MFVRNAWYLAGWSSDVSRAPLQRWLLGEPVLFYRTEAGQVVAMDDRCPHRLVPLSKGRLVGDTIRCSYHGATFAPDGRCVFLPGQDLDRARGNRVYPIEERWGGVWIWMGDPAHADPAQLPDAQLLEAPGWHAVRGILPCAADYQLAVDNLLDLSHEAYLHPMTIGTDEVAEHPATTRFFDSKAVVSRVMSDVAAPPLFAKVRGVTSNIDRYQTVTANLPSFVTVDVKATNVGEPDDREPLEWVVMFFMTPERDGRTHYIFAVTRNFATDNEEIDRMLIKGSLQTLGEDIDMLEAQQEMLVDRALESRTIFTRYDNAPDRFRRLLERMVERELASEPAQ